jgi:hypothetical protein
MLKMRPPINVIEQSFRLAPGVEKPGWRAREFEAAGRKIVTLLFKCRADQAVYTRIADTRMADTLVQLRRNACSGLFDANS